jgi:hypothetical protein
MKIKYMNKSKQLLCLLAVLLISTSVSAQKNKTTVFLKKLSDSTVKVFKLTPKKRRPGVHAKTKTSKTKTSKNYKKLSVGQG